MDTKLCPACNTEKPVSAFANSKRTKAGLFWCCRSCQAAYAKEYNRRKKAGEPIARGHKPKPIIYTVEKGQRFGRGVVIDPEINPSSEINKRGARLLCDCGNEYEASLHDLLGAKGHPPNRSCGCYRREALTNPTLTLEQVEYIQELLVEGFDPRTIAHEIGVSIIPINAIKSGKYIPPEQ